MDIRRAVVEGAVLILTILGPLTCAEISSAVFSFRLRLKIGHHSREIPSPRKQHLILPNTRSYSGHSSMWKGHGC